MVITVADSLLPNPNVPLDPRVVVESLNDVPNIPKPYVGLLVYVKDIDKYVRIKAVNAEEEVETYALLNNASFVINVTNSEGNYTAGMSSQEIYDEYIANGSIPVVKQGESIYNLAILTGELCKFVSVQEGITRVLTVQGSSWQYNSSVDQEQLYYCTVDKVGSAYTSAKSYAELLEMVNNGIIIMLIYGNEIYTKIYDDGQSTMMFASIEVNSLNIELIKIFKITSSAITYLEKNLSQTAGYNKLGIVQTELNNPDTKYMLPIAIDSEGKAFNGLEIIEVEEPGLYVVDENMDAGFSSQVGTYTGGGDTTPVIPENLETRISTNESNITELYNALNGIEITIIEEE